MRNERITVSEVQAAYKKTGLSPRRGVYVLCGQSQCGCPITALYCIQPVIVGSVQSEDVRFWANARYGPEYHSGFVDAVDGKDEESRRMVGRRYDDGFADGRAVASAIFDEAQLT